jgi:hypothetical protein
MGIGWNELHKLDSTMDRRHKNQEWEQEMC